MRGIVILAALVLAVACNRQPERAASAPPATEASAQSGERIFGRERFTIVVRHIGRTSGTTTTHVRDWGRRGVTIQDTTTKLAAPKPARRTHTRQILNGNRVVIIDLETGKGIGMTVPPRQAGTNRLPHPRAKFTGEHGSFAGQACDYWVLAGPPVDARGCITSWGVPLYFSEGGRETAVTEVRLGDGGPDSAFAYDAARVEEWTPGATPPPPPTPAPRP